MCVSVRYTTAQSDNKEKKRSAIPKRRKNLAHRIAVFGEWLCCILFILLFLQCLAFVEIEHIQCIYCLLQCFIENWDLIFYDHFQAAMAIHFFICKQKERLFCRYHTHATLTYTQIHSVSILYKFVVLIDAQNLPLWKKEIVDFCQALLSQIANIW